MSDLEHHGRTTAKERYLELTALLIDREIAKFRRGEQAAIVSFSHVAKLATNVREIAGGVSTRRHVRFLAAARMPCAPEDQKASDHRGVPRMRRSGSSAIDRFVALRIKELRLLAGMTQQQLASQLGISSQQMHKFETGIDRLSAGRLLAIARAFDIEVAHLFEGYRGPMPEPIVDPKTTRMLHNMKDSFLELKPKQQDALTRLARARAVDGSARHQQD